MTIHFEGADGKRKELVQALVDASGVKAEYLGAPGFDYRVGAYIVHKDASIEVDDLKDAKEIGIMLQALRGRGFIAKDDDWGMPEEAPTEQEMHACLSKRQEDGVALSFPKAGMSAEAIDNVRKLIAAKAPLIRLALEVDELPIEETEDKLTFTWLPVTAPPELIDAMAHLLAAIIKLAKRLKRVTVMERDTDNPRYTFRCFLLRLGFIGDEYRNVRRYLMKGIPGNGSKRHPVIEFDAAVDAPSEGAPVEVDAPEKLEAEMIEEEAVASEMDRSRHDTDNARY